MWPPPDPAPVTTAAEYSLEERNELLRIAHQSVATAVAGGKAEFEVSSEHLLEPRGAFTTLHLEKRLRGCVGYIFPVLPLYRTVAETAAAAALNDTRFLPVSPEEAPRLSIEISVLSPLLSIAPEEVEIGRHGLLVTLSGRRGLLLPQVPIELSWNRETFLAETCRKAGLPPDAWQHGATLQAFTAEIFGDPI
jgi:AmmeMemoRadiSam system protein A